MKWLQTHTHTHTHTHTCTQTHTCSHTRAHTHTYTHARTQTHTHTQAHCTHTHTHTLPLSLWGVQHSHWPPHGEILTTCQYSRAGSYHSSLQSLNVSADFWKMSRVPVSSSCDFQLISIPSFLKVLLTQGALICVSLSVSTKYTWLLTVFPFWFSEPEHYWKPLYSSSFCFASDGGHHLNMSYPH